MSDSKAPPPQGTRSAPRVKVDAFVKISGEDREFVFRTRDLSETGLFLYTNVATAYPFRVGSRLSLELFEHEASVSCRVVVVRVVEPGSAEADEYPTGFGVRIADIGEEDRSRLRSMIERLAGGEDLY